MRVIDQDTGKELNLDSTPEMTADLAPIYETCVHARKELRQRKNRGGVTQYIDQSLRCGESVGLFRKHTPDLESAPAWDEKLESSFTALRQSERVAVIQKHVRIQRGRTEGFWKEYNSYLTSDGWQRKRSRVLERSKGQCEGCAAKPATQIHHLTYRHVFDEFLFELVAVCDDCHERLHRDDDATPKERTLEEIIDDLERMDGHPCDGCRFATVKTGEPWCFACGDSAEDASADYGDCGPRRDRYEALG